MFSGERPHFSCGSGGSQARFILSITLEDVAGHKTRRGLKGHRKKDAKLPTFEDDVTYVDSLKEFKETFGTRK